MKRLLETSLFWGVLLTGSVLHSADDIGNSVVKIFSTTSRPDLYKPWTTESPNEITGTGVVIDGKRILTNAHVVEYAKEIEIQPNQTGDKITATVEAVAFGIDLAILKLDEDKFFDTHRPLPIETALPNITDSVMTYGYPTGGETLSITRGIVSRIEYVYYNYPVTGLRIQVDAAINPGNSGGPVISAGKMIGIAFSSDQRAQNIGYIIPCDEIKMFLKDVAEHGHYEGKPDIFASLEPIENPALRAYAKLKNDQTGVLVTKVIANGPSFPLKEMDVITKIGSTPIDNQGNFLLQPNLKVGAGYLIPKMVKDGKVPLTIVRDGTELQIAVPVMPMPQRPQVAPGLYGDYPSYFVYGPMVFSNSTANFLNGYNSGDEAATNLSNFIYNGNPMVRRADDEPAFAGERLVVVSSPFFPHKLCKGYSNQCSKVIKAINGIPIKNLAHLVEVLRDTKDEFIVVTFQNRDDDRVVFRRQEIVASTPEILKFNSVIAQGSPDVLPIWNAALP